MGERRFVNQYQPQTLVIATILCYFDGISGIIFPRFEALVGLFVVAGLLAGGYGIANEKKWGYSVAVAAAAIQVIALFAYAGTEAFELPLLISLIFDGALVALLLHPESRAYQRIWFK